MPTSGDDDYDDCDAESSCYHFLNTPSPCSGCGKVIAKIEGDDTESSGADESSGFIPLLLPGILPTFHSFSLSVQMTFYQRFTCMNLTLFTSRGMA